MFCLWVIKVTKCVYTQTGNKHHHDNIICYILYICYRVVKT